MTSHKFALLTAAALASAGSLVACSSSDDSTSSEATASQSATEEETSSVEEADPSSTDDASTADASESESSAPSVSVVTTTTMLGSVVGDIVACASPDSTAITLMPVGADPHDFSPSSAQVADLVTSDLVVANGLMLEAGLEDALENAESDGATVLEVAPLLDPIPFGGKHGDEHGDEHGDGSEDPHFWFDMNRMATSAEIIGAELAEDNGASSPNVARKSRTRFAVRNKMCALSWNQCRPISAFSSPITRLSATLPMSTVTRLPAR